MFVKLFGSRGSISEDNCLEDVLRAEVESFTDRRFIVRHFVLDELSIDLDVHLSKSPWFPIAVDASRYDLLCQSAWNSKFDNFIDTLLCLNVSHGIA